GVGFRGSAELGWLAMRKPLPQHVVGLLVAGLLCLMAAGVATMAEYGPKRGHHYAAFQHDRETIPRRGLAQSTFLIYFRDSACVRSGPAAPEGPSAAPS